MEEEKSYQEIRKDAIDKYKKYVVPKLEKYEEIRKTKLKPFKNIYIILSIYVIFFLLCLFLAPLLVILFLNHNTFLYIHIFIIIFCVILISFILYIFIYDYTETKFANEVKELKSYIMPLVCNCFPNLKYTPDRKHSTEIYKDIVILPAFDKLNYGNCFEGKHKGVDFIIEEIAAVRQKTTIFSGIIVQFKINKNFKGHTIIIPDSIGHNSPSSKLHYTELEDIIFEGKYDVFTNDDVEARYLITPSLMQQLNKIKEKFNMGTIYAEFYCDTLFLRINTLIKIPKNSKFYSIDPDRMEYFDFLKIDRSLYDSGPFYKMLEEIISILKLIDHFKLDQNIGM